LTWEQIMAIVAAALIYIGLILMVIVEPISPLKKLTKEEL